MLKVLLKVTGKPCKAAIYIFVPVHQSHSLKLPSKYIQIWNPNLYSSSELSYKTLETKTQNYCFLHLQHPSIQQSLSTMKTIILSFRFPYPIQCELGRCWVVQVCQCKMEENKSLVYLTMADPLPSMLMRTADIFRHLMAEGTYHLLLWLNLM